MGERGGLLAANAQPAEVLEPRDRTFYSQSVGHWDCALVDFTLGDGCVEVLFGNARKGRWHFQFTANDRSWIHKAKPMTHSHNRFRKARLFIMAMIAISILVILAAVRLLVPPQRPLFHDNFASGHTSLWPQWKPNIPLREESGIECWFDFANNVVVIAYNQPLRIRQDGPVLPRTLNHEVAKFASDSNSVTFTVLNTQHNQLITWLPKVGERRYTMPPGFARRAFDALRQCQSDSTMIECLAGKQRMAEIPQEFSMSLRDAR